MKKFFIFLFSAFTFTTLFAQQGTFDFVIKPIAQKTQMEAGKDFIFVSFRIAGIGDQATADNFLKKMEAEFQLKKYQLTDIGKFSGFIPRTISADQMRAFLLKYSYDFDYSTVIVNDKSIYKERQPIKNKK